MRTPGLLLVASILLAVPATARAQASSAAASPDDEGLPLPPSLGCLQETRQLAAEIEQEAQKLRQQADAAATQLTQQAIADAKNGRQPGTGAAPQSQSGSGLSGQVDGIAKKDAAGDTGANGTSGSATDTGASSTDGGAGAGSSEGFWQELFDKLPDSVKGKIKDFLNSEIGKILDSFAKKAKAEADKLVDKLTQKYPKAKSFIEEKANQALDAGFGSAKAELGKLVDQNVPGPKSGSSGSGKSDAKSGNASAKAGASNAADESSDD